MTNTKKRESKISELNEKIDNLLEVVAFGGQTAKKIHGKIEKIEAEIKEL